MSDIKTVLKDGNVSEIHIFLQDNTHVTNVYHYMGQVFVDSVGQRMRNMTELTADTQSCIADAIMKGKQRKMGDIDKIHVIRGCVSAKNC